MKILVAVKRVVDYQVKIRIKSDRSGVDIDNVKMSMNPFDEIALEEAIRLKEKGIAKEVVAVSIGDDSSNETLRHALALGADRAILVHHSEETEPLHIAKILKGIAEEEKPELFILGKQAIDNDSNQVGQMLAGILNCSQGTFVSKLELTAESVLVTREVDSGLETLTLSLPAVITTDLRLNEPRFASLPNIMKSKSKPLAIKTVTELGISLKPHIKKLHVEPPVKRDDGVKVNSINELMDILKEKEKVLP